MRNDGEPSRLCRDDLEERTFQFAKKVALYCKKLPGSISNIEYSKQAVRASGSLGANHIEANESLGVKDFALRAKISRKEAKESAYWIRLIKETSGPEYSAEAEELILEATELTRAKFQNSNPKSQRGNSKIQDSKSEFPIGACNLELGICQLLFGNCNLEFARTAEQHETLTGLCIEINVGFDDQQAGAFFET